MAQQQLNYESQLIQLVSASDWFMAALRAVRELGLESWCIGAGAVRNLVWDHLHGYTRPSVLPDVDVVYFDPADLSSVRAQQFQAKLNSIAPHQIWEVINQAAVHLWYQDYAGALLPPLQSLEDGVASWPERATCVGVRLEADDSLSVIAPLGLADLFELKVQRNAPRVARAVYLERLNQKRFHERWPLVAISAD